MKKIICRFDNKESVLELGLKNFNERVCEYNLDTDRVIKVKKTSKKNTIKDKHECNIHYVGMPEFQSKEIESYHKVVFYTNKTKEELSSILKQNITDKTQSVWFPKLIMGKNSKCRVVGGNSSNRYPIYVVSKGRADICKTSVYLSQMEVTHSVVVEPLEVKDYEANLDLKYANIIPLDLKFKEDYDIFSDIGSGNGVGPGAARNFCWQHSIDNGFKWHWVMDDNTDEGFHWLYQNNKIKCRTGAFFCAIEDFVDRYDNIAIAGLNYSKFCKETDRVPPYVLNTRIYSYLLIRNDIPYKWRGRYNEDTDLSLRVLKDGWCTIQFNSFLAGKITTQKMKGGNTDEFYSKEGTLNKSQMLKDMHPDVTEVVWKFNRWHHQVNYNRFKQKLIPRYCVSNIDKVDNYEMKIIKTNESTTNDYKSYLESKYSDIIKDYNKPILNEYMKMREAKSLTLF
jgi:hypothetical protein